MEMIAARKLEIYEKRPFDGALPIIVVQGDRVVFRTDDGAEAEAFVEGYKLAKQTAEVL